jgi:polar amino acid transport system substrate-binding protein
LRQNNERDQTDVKFLLIATAIVFAAATTAATSAQARSLDAIISAGEIRVGVNPSFAPAAMYDDKNELVGFDIDVSNKLAAMLGVKVSYVIVESASRVPFLTSGRIDMVLGGLTRTPDRAKLVGFTLPIMTETLGALTIEGKPFQKLADLNKETVTLAEIRGTTPIPWIAQNLPKAKLLLLDNHPDVLRAVAQGRADAVIDDLASLGTIAKSIDAKWKPLEDHASDVDWDCIGVNTADTTLKDWLNVALFNLESAGFVQDSYRKWFGFDMAAPIPVSPYF